jgi:glutathione synthase/RimK-type ligase-like ATP-grasp enzyme
MKVGILKNADQNIFPDAVKYKRILDLNGVENTMLDINRGDFFERVKEMELFIFRWRHNDRERQLANDLLPVIEYDLGIKCFPDYKTWRHYDNKIMQYYIMKNAGFPMVDTEIFWDKRSAIDWVRSTCFPKVFKLKRGAGSKNVRLVNNRKQAVHLIRRMFESGIKRNDIDRNKVSFVRELRHIGGKTIKFLKGEEVSPAWSREKGYVIFQKYMPANDFDTRVTVIGGRAFAFRRFNRDRDFRASGSGLIDYQTEKIDKRCIQIAFDVSSKMGFQSMAYDFLYNDRNDPVICEISYDFSDIAIYRCPGYWDRDFDFKKGHFWPQYLQLVNLLQKEDLKQIESW